MNPDDFEETTSFTLEDVQVKRTEPKVSITKSQSEWEHLNDLIDIAENVLKMHGYTALADKLKTQKIRQDIPFNITFENKIND